MVELGDREKYRQRRRRPRAPREESGIEISDEVAAVFDLVPEAGEGYRWYDYPYRLLWWLNTGWRRKFMPPFMRKWLNNGVNWLIPFNEHDRDFAESLDSWMHNIRAPRDEHVTTPSIWLVELFPPADLPRLEAALRKNGWDVRQRFSPIDERNHVMLARSRSGGGSMWWNLINVVRHDRNWFGMDAVRERIPPEFDYIELKAVQVGQGLTAVVAEFHLQDEAAQALDVEWHKQHEPLLLWERPRPRSLDRHWATIHQVQLARRSMHYAARDWLTARLPGFFARMERPQPLLELMLFDKLDPTLLPQPAQNRDQRVSEDDALRALGIERPVFRMLTSPDIPKLVLHCQRRIGKDPLGDDPTWTLWGSRPAVLREVGPENFEYIGGNDNQNIAYRLVNSMRNLFLMISVSGYLEAAEERFAEIRDRASARHGKFRPQAIHELRQSFLTLSLDLASMQRDVAAFWKRSWYWEGDPQFSYVPTPDELARARKEKESPEAPINFNERLKERHEDWFEQLRQADSDYRDILSTVSSLGSSADAFRTGRLALWVAVVSLVVAVATVLMSQVGGKSLFEWLWQMIS